MALFGYTNPDILNRHQNNNNDDSVRGYQISWIRRMENFEDFKNKHVEIPRTNIEVFPEKLNDFKINDIAANFQPQVRLFNSFYNGVENEKTYSYNQQVYVPPSYPNHFYNTHTFSPLYLAEIGRKPDNEYE